MSKPRIYHPATVQGFNRIEGFAVFFDGVKDFQFFAYKQPKGDHNTDGWHVCEVTSGVAVTGKGFTSYPAAYDAACSVFAQIKPRKFAAKVAEAIAAHGRAPEPEELSL